MPAIEPLSRLIGINLSLLNKEERILLEAGLFARIYEELKELFAVQEKNYFRLLRLTREQENTMLEAGFVHTIIKDILSTGEYDLKGIAQYTDTFEEVVEEFVTGQNTNPSAIFLRRLINLHSSVRRDLYSFIINKIIDQLMKTKNDLNDTSSKDDVCSAK